ncbi:type IV secretory system conjugative DNA transfer family protein [Candidatus Nomurabacteria bacterium]|nr:type IV secretory system conjugative DNA transfer family protein [Candidatus Nomurabacteria bacterium]
MVPMVIHLPPESDDIEAGGRDQRDLTEEVLSQAQVMYNVISSTATRGFKSKIYGQRHISFEIVAREGLVFYYAVVPVVLVDVIRQAIAAAYPSARLEEVKDHTVFSDVGKISGTIGGEFTLRRESYLPIATYTETKRDAMRALLNALSSANREDGIGIQFLIRPADDGWVKRSTAAADKITKGKGKKTGISAIISPGDIMEALWKPPEAQGKEEKIEDRQLTSLERAKVEAIEDKTRYPGYEVLIRVVVSSNTAARSQTLLKNVVSSFSLFDSPSYNGFKFATTRNIEELVTAYIFRFFPQSVNQNILNSVELATVFHLPDQSNIPTSQVQRQKAKQVDGPTQVMDEGVLLGYNEFRGTKKPIRLSTNDRRRHSYIIGQTGTGKSVLLENIAYQDMMDGRGFAFVDPHGDSVEALLAKVPKERVEDIIYFNPGDMTNPIGLNMFEFENPDQKDFLVQEAISMLYGLYDPGHTGIVGPRLEHIFRNAALLLMSDPQGGTFIDIPKILVDQEFMKSKLKYVTDQTVLDFWTKEWPASQRSNEAGEVVSWVVAKFGPFLSNDAMRNIIGQTKSGFNLRDIMDNRKILLVNLSKGRMGEFNSKLLGIVFIMRFQAAAMSRADIPESERVDFSLFVDEFQNFATDSFESILSEARKYRLNLVLGNQFMAQLTEKIREAIIGNVGTLISGRIGLTDAELMAKAYSPVFESEDLTKMPNHQSVSIVQIGGVPSAPFSMSWIPPMGEGNPKLRDALKRLSSAKYGKPRAVVEKEIFDRLGYADRDKGPGFGSAMSGRPGAMRPIPGGGNSSFLDEWLAKRQQLGGPQRQGGAAQQQVKPSGQSQALNPPQQQAIAPSSGAIMDGAGRQQASASAPMHNPAITTAPAVPPVGLDMSTESAVSLGTVSSSNDKLDLKGDQSQDQPDKEVKISLR